MVAIPYAAKRHLEKLHELSLRCITQEAQELKDLGELLDEARLGIESAFEDLAPEDAVAETLRSALKAVNSM